MSDQNKSTLSAHLLSLLQDCLYSFTDSKQHEVRTAQLSLQGQSVDRAHKAWNRIPGQTGKEQMVFLYIVLGSANFLSNNSVK